MIQNLSIRNKYYCTAVLLRSNYQPVLEAEYCLTPVVPCEILAAKIAGAGLLEKVWGIAEAVTQEAPQCLTEELNTHLREVVVGE